MLTALGLTTGHSAIPVNSIVLTIFAKHLFNLRFDDNVKYLFQDRHILRVLGFNLKQINNGHSKRTKKDGSKPIHQDSVRNLLKTLGYKQSVGLFLKATRKLCRLGLIRGGLFAIDAKTIFKDSPGYEFAKKVYDYKGNHKNRRGYKVTVIQHLKSKIIVAVIITPANISDNRLLLLAVRQAVVILGEGVVKTLLFDKGYWDGKTLYKLKKQYGIDFITPGKANLKLVKTLKRQAEKQGFEKITSDLKIALFRKVEAPNFIEKLNAFVVKDKKSKKKRKKHQPVHVYITTLSWDKAQALYQAYRDRWVIENNAIKELCQYWIFEDFHCMKFNAIRAHIMFSLVLFNLHLLFKSKHGRRFTEKSISAKRAPGFLPKYVVVYYGDYFGIFDIREYTDLLAGQLTPPPI